MRGLENDTLEIGFGMTSGFAKASREALDRRFAEMNATAGASPNHDGQAQVRKVALELIKR